MFKELPKRRGRPKGRNHIMEPADHPCVLTEKTFQLVKGVHDNSPSDRHFSATIDRVFRMAAYSDDLKEMIALEKKLWDYDDNATVLRMLKEKANKIAELQKNVDALTDQMLGASRPWKPKAITVEVANK